MPHFQRRNVMPQFEYDYANKAYDECRVNMKPKALEDAIKQVRF